jgi:SAM-dependent methyltransferase
MSSPDAPSQFYTGLVADLYEHLAAEQARADDHIPLLERSGTPALELACGSGRPLLELVERGYAVEGLDASQDMLDRCRAEAAARRLDVALHLGEMQSFSLSQRYRSIFLAGASFTLLTTDEDATAALERIYAHLEPGGSAMIPLEIPDLEAMRISVGRFREVTTGEGDRLRLSTVALDVGTDGRSLCRRLRFERIPANDAPEILERDWKTRWWSQSQFREMLLSAGFDRVDFQTPGGRPAGPAQPDDVDFVAHARRDKASIWRAARQPPGLKKRRCRS